MKNRKGRNVPSAYIFRVFLEKHPEEGDAIVGYEIYPQMNNAIEIKLCNGKRWLFQISEHGEQVLNYYPITEDKAESIHAKTSVPAVPLVDSKQILVMDALELSSEESVFFRRALERGSIVILPDLKSGKTLYWLRGNEIVPSPIGAI